MGEMRRAIARKQEERRMQDRFASTLTIAAAIIAAVRLVRECTSVVLHVLLPITLPGVNACHDPIAFPTAAPLFCISIECLSCGCVRGLFTANISNGILQCVPSLHRLRRFAS